MNLDDARNLAWPPETEKVKRYCALAEALEQRDWYFGRASELAKILQGFMDWGGGDFELRKLVGEFYAALKLWQLKRPALEVEPNCMIKCLCWTLASMARAAACGYPTHSAIMGGPFVKFTELVAGLPVR